ncbi:tumor protein p53 inducible nuclear protein [Lycorma delicatula]|uniref:tumor protein p53 inducible nuclear protein n=1 Tax=Lycorma delicatula TaxID=130591 RepID=UPI003F515EA7
MFTNLASYFLGVTTANDTAASTKPETETRLQEVEDDWLLIEKSDVQDENDIMPLTRRSSTSSLPNMNMEESWYVTPPPCFTSAGPIMLETSPLENLLIEHPSMSVYHHSSSSQQLQPRVRSRSASPTPQPLPPTMPLQPSNNNRRQPTNVYHHSTELAYLQIKTAQKQQQRKLYQTLKRNQIERNNKVREYSSRNKQLRRADRQNHHSGANNNRKSC